VARWLINDSTSWRVGRDVAGLTLLVKKKLEVTDKHVYQIFWEIFENEISQTVCKIIYIISNQSNMKNKTS